MFESCLVSLLLLAMAPERAAVPVRFTLTAPAPAETVAGKLSLRRATAVDVNVIELQVPGTPEVELVPGAYAVELVAPGWWSVPRLVTIAGAGTIDLALRRTGTVSGTTAADAPKFGASFEEGSLSGEARCAVAGREFRCEVPAGTLDLRFGIPGHVPHYRRGVSIVAGRTHVAGALQFIPGASISGYVKTEDGPLDRARLSLRDAKNSVSLEPGPNGFFIAGPVAPGEYTLAAVQRGLVSVSRTVVVQEGMEARLREPLLLSKPRTLRVTVGPPTDPLGEGWTATLVRRERGRGGETVAEGAVSADGSWTAENLAAGDYRLLVRPVRGPAWHAEDVTVDEPVTTVPVAIDSLQFVAKVRLGDEPLAATLLFNGERSGNAIPFRTNEHGEARGYLPIPNDGQWIVTVKSDDPKVHATTGVLVKTDAPSGVATMDIVLTDGRIAGKVVDEHGAPAKNALVSITGDSLTQIKADEAGLFELRGLPLGQYQVTAAAYLKESDTAEIELKKAADRAELELRLKPYRQWRGMVKTADGQPVRDARVFVVPIDVPAQMAYPAHTDSDGRFAALTPSAARLFDVHVEPRGYAYSFSRRPVSEELNLVVDRRGGTIVVEFDDKHGSEAFLWHAGGAMTALALLSTWQAELEPSPSGTTRVRIPQMEPGDYTICLMPSSADLRTVRPAGTCRTLYLAPFATETVVLRSPTSTSSSPSNPR